MKLKIKNIHIAIIIIGIIFNCISIFHPNLWFDEAYSVGLANKSFTDIWKIGGNDVHPILYYWILHIIYLITNSSIEGSIIAYRIFSAVCISILGILGFTHIRKDFGEKTGALFSFFSYFLPVICIYAAEVRMYSLSLILVTILAIYAYRLAKGNNLKENNNKNENNSVKNWIIFATSSLLCIYSHYYGLMAAGIINCILLGYFIKQKQKSSIIKILSFGAIQLLAYIPWVLYFMKQLKNVSKGFWIGFEFPKTPMELLGVQYTGNLENTAGFIVAMLLYIYVGYKIYKTIKEEKNKENKQENKQYKYAITSAIIYFTVIFAAVIVTIALKTSIVYYRYLVVITGLYIFFISYFISKEKNKYIIGIICTVTVIMAGFSNYKQVKEAYDSNNMTQISYLKENVQPDDVIVFDESNFGTGSVVSLYFTNNKQIYYNPSNWGVEEAYKAFGEQLKIYTNTDFLNECTGRVWIIDNQNSDYYNKIFKNENFKVISQKVINTKYKGYVYNLILVDKEK